MLQPVTKQNFNQMLGRFTTAQLELMVEKYPSFQQAYLLLAKKYQDENNPKFDQQLQLAALYTQDRELLFSIFHQKNIEPAAPIHEPIVWAEETKEPETEALATNPIHLEEIKAEEAIEIELQLTEETKTEPLIEPVEITKPQKEEPAEETFQATEPHSFEEWLRAFNPTLPGDTINPKSAEETDDELNRIIMENTPIVYLHEMVEEETRYSKGLDKFIEEQIEKHKHETPPPAPPAENDLDYELITETMAKVYEMQKKYTKAIKAYEILTLKYPEKSGFFAARINYLKNII